MNFICPKCRGHHFRTSDTRTVGMGATHHRVACKDQYQTGCHWVGTMAQARTAHPRSESFGSQPKSET